MHGQFAGTICDVTDVGKTPAGALVNTIVTEFVAGETRCGARPAEDCPRFANVIVNCGVTSLDRIGTEDGVAVGVTVIGVAGAVDVPPPLPPHADSAKIAAIAPKERKLTPGCGA